ncbi:hypothetical protein D3C87_1970770 [compost metagenome]
MQRAQHGLDILQPQRLAGEDLAILPQQVAQEPLQSRLIEPRLAAEFLVEAEAVEAGMFYQCGKMSTLIAEPPEQAHRLVQHLAALIGSGSRHL